jgi:hypothetical protein
MGHSQPEAFIFEKTKNGSKKSCADNQPCGSLRDFEIDRSSGPRKQPSMVDSAFCGIHAASTHFDNQSQN